MNILYLDHAPVYGGAEVMLLNLLRHMPAECWHVQVATPTGTPFYSALQQSGIGTVAFTYGRLQHAGLLMPFHLAAAAARLARVIRKHDIRLVHSNTVRTHIVGSMAALLTRTPLVWTLHDNTFPLPLVQLLAGAPKGVICVSRWLRDLYAPRGLGAKAAVIYNGLDPDQPLAVKDNLRAELGIPPDAPFLVNVGRLVRGKAPHLFIEAAQHVYADHPEAYFALVGGADQPEAGRPIDSYPVELDQAAAASNLGSHLLITGHRGDVSRFYASADALVYCASQPEGLPNVILEAMQYGLPVAATNIGGAAELVQDGDNGLLVPPGDSAALAQAMLRTITDPPGAQALGRRGRASVSREHDIHHQAAQYAALYDRITAR
ncbi:MAG: glycosyltransferase family 4 protein [Anaerolineae bacterium]